MLPLDIRPSELLARLRVRLDRTRVFREQSNRDLLTGLLTLAAGSATFFDDEKITGYMKELCLLLIWVSSLVIAITTAARQIPVERESRTLFPLLAKPVTRGQVIMGKFLGCWLVSGSSIA